MVVVLLVVFGGDGVYSFSMTLLIGLIVGTYSSVFVASPVLCDVQRWPISSRYCQYTVQDEIEPGVDPELLAEQTAAADEPPRQS